jgi:hypothetical protein
MLRLGPKAGLLIDTNAPGCGALRRGEVDPKTTRDALAELIISFAAEGETDPKRLKALALAALPRTLETQ